MRTRSAFAVLAASLGLIPGNLRIASADPKDQPTATMIVSSAPKAARTAEPNYTRVEDVIYGRRDGNALTMDVFSPKGQPNGAGIVVVSAEYRSGRELLAMLHPLGTVPLLDAGYVVFAAMHSSQPMYTVPAAIEDLHRAVRFVKANAKKYGVDPDKVGAAGVSSGGQLALMMGCAGKVGAAHSTDPVERQSSRVAAVGCFFPPTDFKAIAATCPDRRRNFSDRPCGERFGARAHHPRRR